MSTESPSPPPDQKTADAFADSWLNLPEGSVYTVDQFEDWMAPLARADFESRSVLEMGCGNGSLLVHSASWNPSRLHGIDLGESVRAAQENLRKTGFDNWSVEQADLTAYRSDGFDLAYCIGVLHHLKSPGDGLRTVINNVNEGGRFHCWVYAREGNLPVRLIVEPLRKIFSRFPWWFTKYAVATPLALPVYLYAKLICAIAKPLPFVRKLPLSEYFMWIGKREIGFFRHVIFDQLVTPQTTYIGKSQIQNWLNDFDDVDPESIYIIFRNGNSWKFGGRRRQSA